MTRKFEVGTLVMLKSGGPTMTVTGIRDQSDDIVSCEWFAGSELKRDDFDAVNLTTTIIPVLNVTQLSIWPQPSLGGGCAACNWGRSSCGCVHTNHILSSVSNSYAGPG